MLCKIVLPSKEIFKLHSLPSTYQELFTAVRTRLDESTPNYFTIKYLDSDSELVNLNNDEDLQTAILTSQMDQVKTLRVIVIFKESSERVSTPPQSTVREQSAPLKLVQILEKASIEREDVLTQSQAFDMLKSISMETSKAVKGASQLRLSENQMEAISGFIGLRVKQVMDENMKGIIPSLVAKFQDNRKNLEIINRSQMSQSEITSPAKPSYYTPTPRKANWFGDYNADCICNECSQQIQDIKYVCLECTSYKCCQECENKVEHPHPLLKLRASANGLARSQFLKMSAFSKSHLHISPEESRKSGKNYISGQIMQKKACENKVSYCGKIYLEDAEGQLIKAHPSQEHQVSIVVENIGKKSWPNDVRLCCVNGAYRNRQEELVPLNPGTKQVLHLNIEAPSQPGKYLSQWKLHFNDGEKVRSFGESLFIEVQVEEKRLNYSKSSEENGPEQQRTHSKRATLSLRRGNTFSDSYSNDIEERRRAEKEDIHDKKTSIAKYLNDIFPGCLEEKRRFLKECECLVDLEDITKIVELYIRNLGRSNGNKTNKRSEEKVNPELLYTLS